MRVKRDYKRRTVLIKKPLQFKYALTLVLLFGLACFSVWWETFQSLKGLVDLGLISDPVILLRLTEINRVLLVKVIVSLGLVAILALLLSHFIAGPVFRVERNLNQLKEGDLTGRIKLRRLDQLGSLAQAYNEAVDELHRRITQDRNCVVEAMDYLSKSKPSSSDIDHALERLKHVTAKLKL